MVEKVGQMIMGLGLFFIGIHLVSRDLRHLSSRSFRALVAKLTQGTVRASLLGTVFGALMQSATAVTFILVSMVGSQLIAHRQALPIIAWANVGLTVLAFVAGLSIRTEVLYMVGLSGIAMAFLRGPTIQRVSGVFVGISLLLLGLETISAGASPLHDLAWFQPLLGTVHSPLIGFIVGFGLALLVQSNTAATLITIALARAGALDLAQATMIIYGTNLGTIGIRLVLAAELRGSALQMVRFEDFFCLAGGLLMAVLFFIEQTLSLPLVGALVRRVSSDLSLELAIVFLLSNLLPALLLSPFYGPVARGLCRLWPPGKEEEDAEPKFLQRQAQSDPATALDLVFREEARLLRHAGGHFTGLRSAAKRLPGDEVHRAFGRLAHSIAEFVSELSANPAAVTSAERLKLAQEELTLIVQLEASASEIAVCLARLPRTLVEPLADLLAETWALATRAAEGLRKPDLATLREATKQHGALLAQIRVHLSDSLSRGEPATFTQALDLSGTTERIIWMLHHLAKLLGDAAPF